MRRILCVLAVLAAIAGVTALGATMAEAAFVYSCSPALTAGSTNSVQLVTIINPQLATANLTVKLQAADGTNLNGGLGVTTNQTVAPGNTKMVTWTQPSCTGFCWAPENASTVPAHVRIVSDIAVNASMKLVFGGLEFNINCMYVHP